MSLLASQFSRAVARHQSGAFAEAERIYRAILARQPDHPDALHLLGVIASEAGQHETAAALIGRAIQVRGPMTLYCSNLGLALRRAGRPREAAACYRQALCQEPGNAETWFIVGTLCRQEHQLAEAEQCYQMVVELQPAHAEARFELANLLHVRQDYESAAAHYRQVLAAHPDAAEAWHNLGVTLTIGKHFEDAVAAYRQAIRCRPDYAEAHNNLGALLQCQLAENQTAAASCYRSAIACQNSGAAEARYNLAMLLQNSGQLEEADHAYRELLAHHPNHIEALNNLGNVSGALGRPEEALALHERTLELDPEYPEGHWNRGVVQLLLGDLREGWKGYEWRFRQRTAVAPLSPPQPRWTGQSLDGKRILLRAEQGLGDTVQFIRYAALVKQYGGQVLVECQKPLMRLLKTVPGIDALFVSGSELPPFDYEIPLLSLPAVLETTLANIPAPASYVAADPELAEQWAAELSHLIPKSERTIGICWAGNSENKNDHNRSLSPELLDMLGTVPGVHWVSLQFAAPDPSPRLPFVPLKRDLGDFANTAALMTHLDLVLSVDTSMAHLAEALGRRTWTLLPFAPDWRWMLSRGDSPWYPAMSLFRQPHRAAWEPVLAAVHARLAPRKTLTG